jgi:DNA recombination protein RmuC
LPRSRKNCRSKRRDRANPQAFSAEFENVAEKLLKEKSREFIDVNNNLDQILNPLKENLKAFEEKVDKVYNMEAAERNTLKGVIPN